MKRLEASVILLISISMQSSLYAGNFTRSVRNVIRHEEPHAPRKTTHIEEPHIVSTTASRVSHVQSSETPSLKTFHFKPEAELAITPKAKIDTAQKNVETHSQNEAAGRQRNLDTARQTNLQTIVQQPSLRTLKDINAARKTNLKLLTNEPSPGWAPKQSRLVPGNEGRVRQPADILEKTRAANLEFITQGK